MHRMNNNEFLAVAVSDFDFITTAAFAEDCSNFAMESHVIHSAMKGRLNGEDDFLSFFEFSEESTETELSSFSRMFHEYFSALSAITSFAFAHKRRGRVCL